MFNEKQYRKAVDTFCKTPNFSFADNAFFDELQALRNGLLEMIKENSEDLKSSESGVSYYVSNDGNDENDGKSPQTAFCTLERANEQQLNPGDAVLFRRGDTFRGFINAQSGVNYSAYGVGPKPRIIKSYNASNTDNWVKTNMQNVWCFDTAFDDEDICLVVFSEKTYGEKKRRFERLVKNGDFLYNNLNTNNPETTFDSKVYMYCDKGNPADIYGNIEFSRAGGIISSKSGSNNITVKNLELLYGNNFFWFGSMTTNCRISYCVCGWQGGQLTGKDSCRLGGGGGCWHSCNTMIFDHCHIFQQFDSGVTPQYHWRDINPSRFIDFITTDCLFETTEYTLEYFLTQKNVDNDLFKGMRFSYNLCLTGGQGFGTKTVDSAYVKSWQNHENYSEDCVIDHNIFDRAAARSISISAREPDRSFSYRQLPKFIENVFIEPKNKQFAEVNEIYYAFDEQTYEDFEELGFASKNTFIYSGKQI